MDPRVLTGWVLLLSSGEMPAVLDLSALSLLPASQDTGVTIAEDLDDAVRNSTALVCL